MGPAILITVGMLFLLQSLNVVSFDRTWPAILLVVGVVKLLQSNASSAGHVSVLAPSPTPPRPLPPPPVSDHRPILDQRLLPGRCAMSSPASYPVHHRFSRCYRRRRRRSFAGPFVLIVLGIVFLLGNLHMLSWATPGNVVCPLLAAAADPVGSASS